MPEKSSFKSPIDHLAPSVPATDFFYAVVETPKGSQNKYKYDPSIGMVRLDKVLPAGAVFPHDFGFIPATIEEDGDPLDVLVLVDQPSFPGCIIPVRILGVIEAEQTEQGKTIRNDRLVAAAVKSIEYASLQSLKTIDPKLIEEWEHFFISYDEIEGKTFTPLARRGPNRAKKLIAEGIKNKKKK
jgi:inorganic pyrophosphatase